MVANIGVNQSWVLTFCRYNPNDLPPGDDGGTYSGTHRRPFFIDLQVNVPADMTVAESTDAQLQTWISPFYAQGSSVTSLGAFSVEIYRKAS
jgi:hypothetical protein